MANISHSPNGRVLVTFLSCRCLIFLANTLDPLFFLLHSQLDRVWAAWQAHDRRNRNAIAGGVDQDLNHFDAHPLGTGTPVTKDTVLYMAGIGPDAEVNDVLSTTGGYLCYEYAT
jgi:tyrosinase